jgi:hypothetical protein
MTTITTVTGVECATDTVVVMKNIHVMHRKLVVKYRLSEAFRTDLGKQIERTTHILGTLGDAFFGKMVHYWWFTEKHKKTIEFAELCDVLL